MTATSILRRAYRAAREPPFQIRIEVKGELRLRLIALEDLCDRLDAGQRFFDYLGADAPCGCFGAQLREPHIERRYCRRQCRHWCLRLRCSQLQEHDGDDGSSHESILASQPTLLAVRFEPLAHTFAQPFALS